MTRSPACLRPAPILRCFRRFFSATCLSVLAAGTSWGQEPTAAGASTPSSQSLTADEEAFFEARIRPVLVEHCYECHNSGDAAEGDLALDWKTPLRRGGQSGELLGEDALLLKVLRHEIDGLEMPEGGTRLSERVIADFETWVRQGAPDPRRHPPSDQELAAATSWESIRAKRSRWWSFQPIREVRPERIEPSPASAADANPPQAAIDCFIQRQLDRAGLIAAPPASRTTWLRRVTLALTGLPPQPEQLDAFLQDHQPGARARVVDRLLESPHFGERWARHWMDWVRYAESHGSEGDPRIVGAEHYRDYLIRALNEDVPYDQLVREHVAGDLLPNPRLNDSLGINESLIGTAHWRMVFHGFAPTDALDEKVRFTDDAINVFSKAFMGLTVSCARCHDHKFDPISQADYYALFGVLASTRPGRAVMETAQRQQQQTEPLQGLRESLQRAIVQDWETALVQEPLGGRSETERPQRLLDLLVPTDGEEQEETPDLLWQHLSAKLEDYQRQRAEFETQSTERDWDLGQNADFAQWFGYGEGTRLGTRETAAVMVVPERPERIRVMPKAFLSNFLSSKHAARLTSPDILLDRKWVLWLQVAGGGQAMARYVVQNYPRNGTVYPVESLASEQDADWHWLKFDLGYWQGDKVHIELTAALDAPLLAKNQPRSWFGIRRALLLPAEATPPPSPTMEYLEPLLAAANAANPPKHWRDWSAVVQSALRDALQGLQAGTASDAQAALLDRAIRVGWLPRTPTELPQAGKLLQAYERKETEVEVGTRVPTLAEWQGTDSPLFQRGDHRRPEQPIPRRFLEVIDDRPFASQLSGRLELAQALLSESNPLTARVLVNRLWHHLFGRGLVETPDNFGRLGSPPTHPELLDYLALRFRREHQWSLKSMLREMVLSETFGRDSSSEAEAVDPDNTLLAHYPVRRLDAEVIRDSMLQAAGSLDTQMFGPAVSGDRPRRSVYVRVIRNDLDPFLSAFDAPVPFSATGRRSETNVPAQALMLMNSPQVRNWAESFGRAASQRSAEQGRGTEHALVWMWRVALGRPPGKSELQQSREYLQGVQAHYEGTRRRAHEIRLGLQDVQQDLIAILDPVRERVVPQQALDRDSEANRPSPPEAEWLFDSLQDAVGSAELTLKGTARLEGGALVLDGQGWAESVALSALSLIGTKTFEVLVELDDVQQRGGAAFSLQDLSGQTFDALVFGERQPAQWLAGSNFFTRTQDFGGPPEMQTARVHFVLSYREDGTVQAFRNGQPYGETYRTQLQAFEGRQSRFLFGLRHGKSAQGNRTLRGKLLEARFYKVALNADEARAAWERTTQHVSDEQVLALLRPEQRSAVATLREQRDAMQQELDQLRLPEHPTQAWTDLAHALFNMKEFIYVR